MIGGCDLILANPGIEPSEVLNVIVRSVFSRWPQAIAQHGATGDRYSNFASIPFSQMWDIFVYRDTAAFDSWEKLGADPSNVDTMIHVIVSESAITLVVDNSALPMWESLWSEVEHTLAGILRSRGCFS